jgi:hypothetical protein
MTSQPNDKINRTKYQHIVAWGRYLQSGAYYIEDQIDLAEKDNAPVDAIYKDQGTWWTMADVVDPQVKTWLEEFVN